MNVPRHINNSLTKKHTSGSLKNYEKIKIYSKDSQIQLKLHKSKTQIQVNKIIIIFFISFR